MGGEEQQENSDHGEKSTPQCAATLSRRKGYLIPIADSIIDVNTLLKRTPFLPETQNSKCLQHTHTRVTQRSGERDGACGQTFQISSLFGSRWILTSALVVFSPFSCLLFVDLEAQRGVRRRRQRREERSHLQPRSGNVVWTELYTIP